MAFKVSIKTSKVTLRNNLSIPLLLGQKLFLCLNYLNWKISLACFLLRVSSSQVRNTHSK